MLSEQNVEQSTPDVQPSPDPHVQANLDAEAAIRAIEADWAAKGLGDDAVESVGADAPAEGAGDGEATEAVAAPTDGEAVPPPEAAAEDRSIARLVEREVAVRQREDAVKASEERYAALEKEFESLREQYAAVTASYQGDFHEQLKVRPGDTLRAAGHDPDHVVRLYLAEKMVAEGKPVPPELSRAIKDAEYEHRISAQEKQLQEYQRQQAAAQWVHGIELGARTYLSQEISKHAPTLAAVAKANPDYAFKALMDEIAADVQSRKGKDLSATVLTYEEASKRAEVKLAAHKKLFADPPAAGTTAPTTPAPKATVKSSSPTAPKPLVAQKTLSQKELEDQAIAAGIAEHRRIEMAKKANRTA